MKMPRIFSIHSKQSCTGWAFFRVAVWVLFLIGCAIFFYANRNIIGNLRGIAAGTAILLLGCVIILTMLLGLQFKLLLESDQIRLPFKEWYGLTVLNTFLNQVMPFQSGIFARAIYLRRTYLYPFSAYAVLSGILYLTSMAGASIVIITCGKALLPWRHFILLSLIVLFPVGLLVAIYLFSRTANGTCHSEKSVLRILLNSIRIYGRNGKLLAILIGIHVLINALLGIRLSACFSILHVQKGIMFFFLVQSLVSYSTLINIVPGNLGIGEGIIGLCGILAHIPLEVAISAALIDRAVMMLTTSIISIPFIPMFLKRKTEASQRKSSTTALGGGGF